MIIKNKRGEVRLLLRFILLVGLSLIAAFVLRAIPIVIQTQLLVQDGWAREEAMESARTLFMESPGWKTILGVLQGLLWLPIVVFMMRTVEKQPFSWEAVGLDWRHTSPLRMTAGLLTSGLVYAAYLSLGQLFGSEASFQSISAEPHLLTNLMTVILLLVLGFGEELGFRAYLQTRLIGYYGTVGGIVLTGVLFTLVHMVMRPLSPVEFISGVALFSAIGGLYAFTQSLYLVGVVHAVLNILPEILGVWGGVTEGLLVHIVFLAAVCVLYFKPLRAGIKPVQQQV